MNILISGGTGFIGTALTNYFTRNGHRVIHLSRTLRNHHAYWDLDKHTIDFNNTPAPDIVINLSGENIAERRWSEKQKAKIIDSRVNATNLLVETINQSKKKPQLFISGSAIGFYGHRGDEIVDENSALGQEYNTDVCKRWEQASQQLDSSIRLVNIRTGIVLGKEGGTLKKLLLPFQLGLGGKIGNGQQYLSWISMTDMVNAIDFIIKHEAISGAVNMVAPNPVTNQEFTSTLAMTLHRPALLPMPAWLVRLLFGEMGDALLLSSTRVRPGVLTQHGYQFEHPQLQDALNYILRPR